ncbi:hypothetical protein FXO37_07507 [Capsicum annuum]|nr:hypothetical protein FXO37_07507 [Capsicum annuum]
MENEKTSHLPQVVDNVDRMGDNEDDILITGQVTMGRWDSDVDEDFCDPDYNISDEDDGFQEMNCLGKLILKKKLMRFKKRFHMKSTMKLNIEIEMKFGGFELFKQTCRDWDIKHRRQLYFSISDTVRVICSYKKNGCPFRILRSVVVVDGAHLSELCKGSFPSASILDGAECDNMCVLSDRNESIIKAVIVAYPNVPHLVKASSTYIYSVYESEKRYIVDLESGSCNCGRFQIDQVPCSYAIVILKSKHVKDFGPYCPEYYKPSTLVKTYEVPIISMPGKKD